MGRLEDGQVFDNRLEEPLDIMVATAISGWCVPRVTRSCIRVSEAGAGSVYTR